MKKVKASFLGITAIGIMLSVIAFPINTHAQEDPVGCIIELNLVFLHGMCGKPSGMKPLKNRLINTELPPRIIEYESNHPGVQVEVKWWNPQLDNNEGIGTWAQNIANYINNNLPDKGNLILVGHSMGGKSAIYAVRHNEGGLRDKTLAVVTINSPIEELDDFVTIGGGHLIYEWCHTKGLLESLVSLIPSVQMCEDEGICYSLARSDTRSEAKWVANHKHWLAFISAEPHPKSGQCDLPVPIVGDLYPWNMDDGVVPIRAQYTPQADVVYYGNHCHFALHEEPSATNFIAKTIANYIFGDGIDFSALVRSDTYEHKADIYLGPDHWEDIRGDVLAYKDGWSKTCNSFPTCSWDDLTFGCNPCPEGDERSHYEVNKGSGSDPATWIDDYGWKSSNENDCRIYVEAGAGFRNWLKINWKIYRKALLPSGDRRDHYEVEIIKDWTVGGIFEGIDWAKWETTDPRDCRIRIRSWAQSPGYWMRIAWRAYKKETRQVSLISDVISDITLCGEIWDGNGGPLVGKCYLVTCDVEVPSGKTLTVQPGAQIYFESGRKITAHGTLNANGELNNPIYLVSMAVPDSGIMLKTSMVLKNGGELRPGE